MEFEFSEDFLELKAMLRRFCAEVSSEQVVRTTMMTDEGFDRTVWRRLGTELDVLGLSVPQHLGGDGAGLVFTAGLVEELGAALLCGPVLGTICLAIPVLSAVPDDATAKRYLGSLISGEKVATLAINAPKGVFDAERINVRAYRSGMSWTLAGGVTHVPDGGTADTLLVAARTEDGVALFAVDGSAIGVGRTSLSTLDLTRRQADVVFDGCPADLLADVDDAPRICERALQTAATLLACDQVGGAQRMLDETIAHVSSRLQFGQPIGAFQAVKHRCANMLVALEQARSAAYHAAWALQDGTDDERLSASLARTAASEAFLSVSTGAIQLHGGLGFTWDGLPHLYFKRATTDALILGTVDDHIEVVAAAVVDPGGEETLVDSHR